MPAAPQETKFHPSAVDLLLIKRLIAETMKPKFDQFLEQEFVGISKALAKRLIGMHIIYFFISTFRDVEFQTAVLELEISYYNSLYIRYLIIVRLCTEELGPEFSPKMSVKSLTPQQILSIQQLFRQAKFEDPSGDVSNLRSFTKRVTAREHSI